MTYAIADIGNTNVKLGIVKHGNIEIEHSFGSVKTSLGQVRDIISKYNCSHVTVCSVKPAFFQEFSKFIDIPLKEVDYSNIPLAIDYTPPSDVGSDRLVAAYCVVKKFSVDAIVIDLGTAVTCEIVKKPDRYLGGIIFPGINLITESLGDHTALLPQVTISQEDMPVLGKSTVEAIRSGVFFGLKAFIFDTVGRLKEEFGNNLQVVVTGRGSEIFKNMFPDDWDVVDSLVLEGLVLLDSEIELNV